VGTPPAGPFDAWQADGYLLLAGFADVDDVAPAGTAPPGAAAPGSGPPAGVVDVADVVRDERVLDLVGQVLGDPVDVLGGHLVVTQPGEQGPPWHQGAARMAGPAPPDRAAVVRLAVTEATLVGGCPWVVPGSHTGPLRPHRPARRSQRATGGDARNGGSGGDGRNGGGDVEIVAGDTTGAVPVVMAPGDLLLLDGRLVHRATDNHSRRAGAALVGHYGRWVSTRQVTG